MAAAFSFTDLLAPMPVDAFFESHCGRRWAHIEGAGERFADTLPWTRVNELFGMTGYWTGETLRLSLDGNPVPVHHYCDTESGQNAPHLMRPLPAKVMALLRQGAVLVAGGADSAAPGIASISDALESELGATASCSIVCTSRQRLGRPVRFDLHDAYIVQVHGEKRWDIYQNRVDAPVPHPGYLRGLQSAADDGPGDLASQVVTRPGDVLYLPRGQYYQDVSHDDASLHLAFGVMAFTGLEFLTTLMVQAVYDPVFRQNLPRSAEGGEALDAHLAALSERIRATAADPGFVSRFTDYQLTKKTARRGFALPVDPDAPVYRLADRQFRVEQTDTQCFLVGPKGRVEIPAAVNAPVRWIIGAEVFTEADVADNNPDLADDDRAKLLADLGGMGVIERI